MSATNAALEFEHVTKKFGSTQGITILNDLSFTVKKGEFFSFLGPSGCGKTTCLRLISGLERPTTGIVRINGQVVNDVHPHKRNVHMVFQKYALFPHLSVYDNVAFGLRMKKQSESKIKDQVQRMIKMVHLENYEKRAIQQLSGGEQQRVALVRALVNEPAILLLDEPLGALDLKLREAMQVELAAIQKQLGTTFIFVTHDQGEALTLSDRIAIMNKGRIEQIGTPTEVYESPATTFAAHFVGSSNTFNAKVLTNQEGLATLDSTSFGKLTARLQNGMVTSLKEGEPCQMIVRPEKIRIRVTGPDAHATTALNSFRGTLMERVYFGPTTQIKLLINDSQTPLTVLVANQTAQKMPQLKLGEKYYAVWDASDCTVLRTEAPR